MPKWSEQELEELAYHVHFEVVTLVDQVDRLIELHVPRGPEGSMTGTEIQAMLEAALVHLRLLDDFLGPTRKFETDVHASDWVPDWTSRPWLHRDVRKRVEWQVAHLASQRMYLGDWDRWDLPTYTKACCDELVRFFDSVSDEKRLETFLDAPEVARATAARLSDMEV